MAWDELTGGGAVVDYGVAWWRGVAWHGMSTVRCIRSHHLGRPRPRPACCLGGPCPRRSACTCFVAACRAAFFPACLQAVDECIVRGRGRGEGGGGEGGGRMPSVSNGHSCTNRSMKMMTEAKSTGLCLSRWGARAILSRITEEIYNRYQYKQ